MSVCLALLSPLSLSIKHIFVRTYKKVYNSWDVSIDGLMFEYQIYFLIGIFYFTQGEIIWGDFLLGSFGSCFIATGKILIVLAVANGLAGPAASLMLTQIIYLTLLTTFVSGQELKSLEVLGLAFGILGALIVSSGELILSHLKIGPKKT